MNNIFIATLPPADIPRLQQGCIPFVTLTIGSECGIVLEETYLANALALLNLREVKRANTVYHGVVRADVALIEQQSKEQTSAPAVQPQQPVETFGSVGEHLLRPLRAIYLPMLKRNVCVHLGPREQASPIDDGRFHIFIACTPLDRPVMVRPPDCVFGVPLECRDHVYPPSGRGISIEDPAGGYAAAEVIGNNNLYIHHKVHVSNSISEQRLFMIVLDRALPHLGVAPAAIRTRLRAAFLGECSKWVACSYFESDDAALPQRRERIKQLKRELNKANRDARVIEQKLLRGEGLGDSTFGREYDALRKIPNVTDVRVENNSVVISTKKLYCTDDRTGRRHEIGAFKILLPMHGTSPLWLNQTRQVRGISAGMNAPHVYSDGHACLGNTTDAFAQLFQQRQFAVAAMLAIEFVQQANTSDAAGAYISNWPRA